MFSMLYILKYSGTASSVDYLFDFAMRSALILSGALCEM